MKHIIKSILKFGSLGGVTGLFVAILITPLAQPNAPSLIIEIVGAGFVLGLIFANNHNQNAQQHQRTCL